MLQMLTSLRAWLSAKWQCYSRGGVCPSGFTTLTYWWTGWCSGRPDRFFSLNSDQGAMRSNATAARFLSTDHNRLVQGFISLEVFFPMDRVPQRAGGLHLFAPVSAHVALGSPVGVDLYNGWLRADFGFVGGDGPDAELQLGIYNCDADGRFWFTRNGQLDAVVDEWRTGIILRPGVWNALRFSWTRRGDQFIMMLNGKSHITRIHPTSFDIQGMSVGNMDNLADFGGVPEVRFRNLRWGAWDISPV